MNHVLLTLSIYAFFSLLLVSCQTEQYQLCPDNVTQVINLSSCPKEKSTCPATCVDSNNCTRDLCSSATNYTCTHDEITPCNGNNICELSEFSWSQDCPKECNDNDQCTSDSYNYTVQSCVSVPILPCCGNKNCETGETHPICPLDCEQELSVTVTHYQTAQRLEGAYKDLTQTNYRYITVYFKIRNIRIDKLETLDYRKEKGFLYDPFKMKLEDSSGKKYDVEYDSDISKDWRDALILPKGDTISASATFIVPIGVEHVQFVAYDRYGSRLDVSEVY